MTSYYPLHHQVINLTLFSKTLADGIKQPLFHFGIFNVSSFLSVVGVIESSNGKSFHNDNNKNKHKQLLLHENLATNNTNPSLSTNELPEKHLSLQMETLPECFVNTGLSSKGALTKKDFYHYQQCSRCELFFSFFYNLSRIKLY